MLIDIYIIIIISLTSFLNKVFEICDENLEREVIFSVKSESQFCLAHTTQKTNNKFRHFDRNFTLDFVPFLSARNSVLHMQKITPVAGVVWWLVRFGAFWATISFLSVRSITYVFVRTCVRDPAYVAHVDRVVSATRFGDSPVSSCISLRDYSVCQVH